MVMVCDRHGLWPSWFVAVVAVAVMVCGRHGLWPSWYRLPSEFRQPYTMDWLQYGAEYYFKFICICLYCVIMQLYAVESFELSHTAI